MKHLLTLVFLGFTVFFYFLLVRDFGAGYLILLIISGFLCFVFFLYYEGVVNAHQKLIEHVKKFGEGIKSGIHS